MKYVIKSHIENTQISIYLKVIPHRNQLDTGVYTQELDKAVTFDGWYEAQKILNILSYSGKPPFVIGMKEAMVAETIES